MDQPQQTGTNDKNPQFKEKGQNQAPLTTQRAVSTDRWNDLRNIVRANSLPTGNFQGLKKTDLGLTPEDRLINVSNLLRNQTAPRDLNFGNRSRLNTSPDTNGLNVVPGLRRFTEDPNRSRIGDLGKRSILELQQSLINPHFRRMTSRIMSQAKIQTFKTVKSQRVYPEALIYKIKKITMTRKLDPEVGKIKLRIDEFGNQELNKFPKQQVPVRKNIVDVPSSISSYNTLSKSPSKNDLNSRISRSIKTDMRLPVSTNKQDSRSLYTNLLSPVNPLVEDSNKFDFTNDPEISPRVRINETVDENNQRSNTFGINPVPVIPLKPKIGLPTPTINTRASFSQDKKLAQPHRPASMEKEETLLVQKPTNGLPMEAKLNAFRKQLRSPDASQNNMRSLLESKDYSNIEMNKSTNKNPERPVSPPNRIIPKGRDNQNSIMITESNPMNQPNISQSEVMPFSVRPDNHESNNQTIDELIANDQDPIEILLVSNADKYPAESSGLKDALNDINNLAQGESNSRSKASSENINDGDIEGEENDVVPKIDFLKKFKGKDDFSTIHETEEENRSISSKFGTELHFGTKGPGNPDKIKPSVVNQNRPLKASIQKRDSNPTMTEFNTESGYHSSKQNIMIEARKYGTEVPNDSNSESDTKFVARQTMIPLSNPNRDIVPRFSDPVRDTRTTLNFKNEPINIDTLQIETSTEKTEDGQSYLANDSRDAEPSLEESQGVKINPQSPNRLKSKPLKDEELLQSEITLQTDQFDKVNNDHKFHTNNDLDAYLDGIHESIQRRNEDSLPTVTDKHRESNQTEIDLQLDESIKPGNSKDANYSNQKPKSDIKSDSIEEPELKKETLIIPTIEPADVIFLSSKDKCKDIESIPSVSPEAIWSHKIEPEDQKHIVATHTVSPIQVFFFREEQQEKDGLRPRVPNTNIPPSEVTSINQANQTIRPQVSEVKQPPAQQIHIANSSKKINDPNNIGVNNPNQLAVPRTQDPKDKQPLLSPNSESQVVPARSVDINPQSHQDKSNDFKPLSNINSRREVRDDLTPIGSLRRKSALKNTMFPKRLDQNMSPDPKKVNLREISSDGSKMSYDSHPFMKENVDSLRSNNFDEDSKRVGWAVSDNNSRSQRQAPKGQRTRIDFPEPSVNEIAVPFQKISQKFVKFYEEPVVDETENSLSYHSLEDSLVKRPNSVEDEFFSLANTSLIKLDHGQLQTLSKRDTDALSIYVNTLKDRKKINNAKVLGSLCCIFFFLSSILWIVLMKILHDKNSFLSNIIMYPPTLGLYHQVYTQFFVNYDRNYELFQEANKNLNQQIFPNYHKKIQALKEVSELKLDNSIAMLGVKKYIADIVDRLPSQKALKSSASPRSLALGSSTAASTNIYKTDLLPSSAITRILRRLEAMKEQIKRHRFSKEEMEEYLQDIQLKSEEMYQRCLELIDNFGRFFIMTNRIWVTTENIYRFYQSKAKEVVDEMTMEHYCRHKHSRKEIRLLNLHYKTWAKLIDFPIIKIRSERKILLMCSIKAEVFDPELKYISQVFDFYLDSDNSIQSSKQNFEHQVDREKYSVIIGQMLNIPPGIHEIELYAMITGNEIVFKNLEVDCVEHLEYQNIPEFRK